MPQGDNQAGFKLAFTSFLLCGGILSFPGVILDLLLTQWKWTPADFGYGLFVQGCFALVGTRIAASFHSKKNDPALYLMSMLVCAVGTVLLYFSWHLFEGRALSALTFAGFAFLGCGVGSASLINNGVAFSSLNVPRALNILNMAYTVGAVLVPALTAVVVNSMPQADIGLYLNPWQPVAFILCCAFFGLALFSHFSLHPVSFEKETTNNSDHLASNQNAPKTRKSQLLWARKRHTNGALTQSIGSNANELNFQTKLKFPTPKKEPLKGTRFGIVPLICAAVVMGCYVGTEINLSNLWVPLIKDIVSVKLQAGIENDLNFRLASPLYWGGLFASRIFFSFVTPPPKTLVAYIVGFGLASSATLGIAMTLQTELFGFSGSIFPYYILLILSCGSGLFIGASYSFTLGALTYYYSEIPAARRANAIIIQFGVLGAIAFPPAVGVVTAQSGTPGALVFVFLSQLLFSASAIIWLAVKPKAMSKL